MLPVAFDEGFKVWFADTELMAKAMSYQIT